MRICRIGNRNVALFPHTLHTLCLFVGGGTNGEVIDSGDRGRLGDVGGVISSPSSVGLCDVGFGHTVSFVDAVKQVPLPLQR